MMRSKTFSLLVFLGTVTPVQHLIARSPIPDDSARKAAVAIVAEVHKAEYQAAKTVEDKITLAKKLLAEGMATKDDLAGKYVLLCAARDLAVQQGDLALGIGAIDHLSHGYEIDWIQMKATAAEEAIKALRTAKANATVLPSLGLLIEEAFAADRFDVAKSVCEITMKAAKDSRDLETFKRLTTKYKFISEAEIHYMKVKEALLVLETKPSDPAANLTAGWFYAAIKGNWQQGIPMLALGNAADIKGLAAKEIAEFPNAMELGDGWWEIAEIQSSPLVKERVQAHAAQWYRLAIPALTGLTKAKVEQRLATIESTTRYQEQTPKVSKEPPVKSEKLVNQLTNTVKMQLVLIPPGEYQMGSAAKEDGRAADEHQHKVKITKPFYIGQHEVTVGQFREFVDAEGYKTDAEKSGVQNNNEVNWQSPGFPQKASHPATFISWNDAIAYCKWLSLKEKRVYRLPTEAEWEYACRAGSTGRYYFGNDQEELASFGNGLDAGAVVQFPHLKKGASKATDGFIFTSPVGSFRPNAAGLYDVHGNVHEWCIDWYDANYYKTSSKEDPQGPATGVKRVMRGGMFSNYPVYCRSANRADALPNKSDTGYGFRVVLIPSG